MASKRLSVQSIFDRIAAALATVLVACACGPDLAFAVVYTNVTASAGINHLQHPGNAPGAGLFRTGGAAAADFDNDGWVDLFVTRLNARPLLYRNLGNGTFQDVAVAAGFTSSLPANGPAWGDIDNDGDKDLYVTSSGGTRFYLYVNNGNGTFTEQAVARGAAIAGVFRYGQSVTFGDYDGDGYLDIHTNDWGTDISVSTSRLLRNLGAANPGHFEDVTAAAGLDVFRPSHFARRQHRFQRVSLLVDVHRPRPRRPPRSGDCRRFQDQPDILEQWRRHVHRRHRRRRRGHRRGRHGKHHRRLRRRRAAGLVRFRPGRCARRLPPHSGNRLFRNNGDRTFADQTDLAGVRDSGWSWGTTFLDHDNDRDLDLFVTNGWDPTIQRPIAPLPER